MELSAKHIGLSDDVAFREMSGQSVLLNLASGTYFGLNEVGTRLWALLEQNSSLEQAMDALLREFEVPVEVLRADVNRLVADMMDKGLVNILSSEA